MNILARTDLLIAAEDIDGILALDDNAFIGIGLYGVYDKRYTANPALLNEVQLDLLLSMHLENAGQSDSILAFLQEWFPQYQQRVVVALERIGVVESAKYIEQAIALLPIDNQWFFEVADENSQALLEDIDRKFSGYPDGSMPDLYRAYAERHRELL